MGRDFVSIVMSVYNAEPYLRESIESILGQSHEYFEFIIVDDGSEDGSRSIINEFSDQRLRIIRKENTGLAHSLNLAIDSARADLIARMDADDLAHPQRIEKQVKFMSENPDCAIVGSNAIEINEEGQKIITSNLLEEDSQIREKMINGLKRGKPYTPFYHSSVMFRKTLFLEAGKYPEKVRRTEDVQVFYKMILLGKFSNLKPPYLTYRIHRYSVSRIDPAHIGKFMHTLTRIIQLGEITDAEAYFINSLSKKLDNRDREYFYTLYQVRKLMTNKGQLSTAFRLFTHALRIKPMRLYAYSLLLKALAKRIFLSN